MSIPVIWNGTSYLVPQNSESGWGTQVTNLLVDLSTNAVSLTTSQTLTNKILTSPTITSPTITGTGAITANTLTANTSTTTPLINTASGALAITPAGTNGIFLGSGTQSPLYVQPVASGVNGIKLVGSATAGQVVLEAYGNDANVQLAIYSQGRAPINLNTGANIDGPTQVQIVDVAGANRYITLAGSNGGNPAIGTSGGGLAISSAGGDITLTASSNLVIVAGTGSIRIPSGTTAQRNGSPANGMIRYNTDSGVLEGYIASSWQTVLSGASAGNVVGPGSSTTGAPATFADTTGRLLASSAWLAPTLLPLTAGTTLAAGNTYFLRSDSGSFNVTLPASPPDGTQIGLQYDTTFSVPANRVTVLRNGNTIAGNALDMILTDHARTLFYSASRADWSVL